MRRWQLMITVAILGTVNAVFAEDWKGSHANDGLVKDYMAKGLSKSAAETKAKEAVDQQKKKVEKAHPGLGDGKYSYDCYQDIVVGTDGKPPNCFGDAAKGGKVRWEPTDAELSKWIKAEGYAPVTTNCRCECGKQKIAVYILKLKYREGAAAPVQEMPIPIHIAEEQENCSWRSRMGDLGVFSHDRPEQLWSRQESADILGKAYAKGGGVDFVSCTVELRCFAKNHARRNFHGKPNGPLDCD